MTEPLAAVWAAIAMSPPEALALLALPAFLISAAASDVYRFIIPNWTSLGLLGGWLLAWALSPLGWEALWGHAIVFAAALVVSILLFELGVWGGGDAKLAPCAMLWLGWPGVLEALLVMCYVGVGLAVVAIGWRLARRLTGKGALSTEPAEQTATDGAAAPEASETDGIERHTHAPYGVAIAAGALWAAGQAPVVIALAPAAAAALP